MTDRQRRKEKRETTDRILAEIQELGRTKIKDNEHFERIMKMMDEKIHELQKHLNADQ